MINLSYLKFNESNSFCEHKLWINTSDYEKNPEHLGNYIYANRMGNSDESFGDDYRYRGRGVIQLTGKDAYSNFATI